MQHAPALALTGADGGAWAAVQAQLRDGMLRAACDSCLGRGSGLTPAGDDAAAGILLLTPLFSHQLDVQQAQVERTGLILEGFVAFQREVSVVAVRGRDGSFEAWPVLLGAISAFLMHPERPFSDDAAPPTVKEPRLTKPAPARA